MSYATVKYGCVIKYVFVYIGTMISCIYFQRVVAVLMKGVVEGNEECPSLNTSGAPYKPPGWHIAANGRASAVSDCKPGR